MLILDIDVSVVHVCMEFPHTIANEEAVNFYISISGLDTSLGFIGKCYWVAVLKKHYTLVIFTDISLDCYWFIPVKVDKIGLETSVTYPGLSH